MSPTMTTSSMPDEWEAWEDHALGMYSIRFTPDNVSDSINLLTDPDHFLEVAREMVREWPNSARHNLIHLWTGRRAWIGQASCLYAHGSPGAATREAWGCMTNPQQRAANAIADLVMEGYTADAQVLF